MSLADALKKAGIENVERQNVRRFLSTGYPPLDYACAGSYRNGGFPEGRITEMFGPSSAGKTAIATFVMISAQKRGGVAIFMDHERSFDVNLAIGLGLDVDPDKWVYRMPKTFEGSIDEAVTICELIRSGAVGVDPEAPIALVFDSLAAMVPQSKFEKATAGKTSNMHDKLALAAATSSAFPAFNQRVDDMGVTVILLNQIREQPGVTHGDNTKTPGGKAPEFYASLRVKLDRTVLYDEKTKERPGQRIRANTVKNKVHRPFQKTEWDFLFTESGEGSFDVIGGTIEMLASIGVLERAGAYIEWQGKKYFKSVLKKKIEDEGLIDALMELLPEDDA